MAPDSPAARIGLVAGVLALVVLFSQLFLPQVVSWNDEAARNDSVDSDALVMPSSSASPFAG